MEKGETKDMNYEPVIGLEVHVETKTKSKMFCPSHAKYFGEDPNTHTCPICLGLPGALPFINEEAINNCIKIGLALNCSVNTVSRFERKNYFYPDLPKGYQVSQYRWPLCVGGWLSVVGSNGKETKIRINRVHQEEDTGKLSHTKGVTFIDFNRSGVPLVEIVTEPDFNSPSQVKDFAKKLQQLFRYLGVSEADMEKGEMRLEANVSVRKLASHLSSGSKQLPDYRVELKNINSFRFMEAAINYEIKRQIEALEKGEKLTQETRGWDDIKKETYIQRTKEQAHDYRYFPEPDLPELRILESRVKSQESSLPELPWDKVKRFVSEYGITVANAEILASTKELAEYFEEAVGHGKAHEVEAKQVANYIINQKPNIGEVLPTQVVEEIKGKKVGVIESIEELEKLTQEAIKENPESVTSYKKGKLGALNVLLGAVMKKSSGKADILKTREILEKLLK